MKDWSKISSASCFCRCGREFRAKAQIDMERRRSVSEIPCPGCGKTDDLWKVSGDPETFEVRGS